MASAVTAQEISVPDRPSNRDLMSKAEKANNKSRKGHLGIQSAILVPLDGENYAFLYGILLGKRNGTSFHYFENEDTGFVCKGTGKPTSDGVIVTNEGFLNGESTGVTKNKVARYGKVAGKITFKTYDKGEEIGLAAMQWGLQMPKPKALLKYLKANGG